MDKFRAFAVTAVLAAVAAPSLASAATVVPGSAFTFYNGDLGTGSYAASLTGTGAFSVPLTFDVGNAPGAAALSISNVSLRSTSLIDNLVLTLNGVDYAINTVTSEAGAGGTTHFYKSGAISQQVDAGVQQLTISGSVPGNAASFSGSIDFTASAVPEPASWGLMIVGLGAVGVGLRRRRTLVATPLSHA